MWCYHCWAFLLDSVVCNYSIVPDGDQTAGLHSIEEVERKVQKRLLLLAWLMWGVRMIFQWNRLEFSEAFVSVAVCPSRPTTAPLHWRFGSLWVKSRDFEWILDVLKQITNKSSNPPKSSKSDMFPSTFFWVFTSTWKEKSNQFHGPSEFLCSTNLCISNHPTLKLGGGFQHFICSSRTLRKWSNEQWKKNLVGWVT